MLDGREESAASVILVIRVVGCCWCVERSFAGAKGERAGAPPRVGNALFPAGRKRWACGLVGLGPVSLAENKTKVLM